MTDLFDHDHSERLTGFFVALINHCEAEIDHMRTGFQMELRRIKTPDAQAAYKGDYTVENCGSRLCDGLSLNGKAFASPDFIRVVREISNLCDTQIGAVPLLLDTPIIENQKS